MVDCNISIFSLNVNGLGDSTKRTAVLTKLKKKYTGIYLLQETHSVESTEHAWKTTWGSSNLFFSHGSSNSKGVAILISNNIDFKLLNQFKDECWAGFS